MTLGVPFYGRFLLGGDWRSYEAVVGSHAALDPTTDEAEMDMGALSFNGPATIAAKTIYALDRGAGGVMVWEVGQDCRER